MTRVPGIAILVALSAALGACDTKPSRSDEAAIRQFLANLEKRINNNDIGFVDAFAKDAVIMAPGTPDVVGYDAIRAMYAGLLQQDSLTVQFMPQEIVVAGDLAYERGTYTLRIVDRKSGKVVQDVRNKDVHILKRQPDGSWKTWRMMVNSAP